VIHPFLVVKSKEVIEIQCHRIVTLSGNFYLPWFDVKFAAEFPDWTTAASEKLVEIVVRCSYLAWCGNACVCESARLAKKWDSVGYGSW
jgi:hypothetical protein